MGIERARELLVSAASLLVEDCDLTDLELALMDVERATEILKEKINGAYEESGN